MTKAAKALSRVIATRKTRAPLTLTANDNVRSVLDAHRGLRAAEETYFAAVQGILVGSKRREPLEQALNAAREAYRLHVAGMIERIAGSKPGATDISSTDDLLTLAVISYLGCNSANHAIVGYLVH